MNKLNILLVGEFSGYHKNLKEGLEEEGHNVLFISSGDGFKKISSDIVFSKYGKSGFDKIKNSVKNILLIKKFRNFDIVQFVNPFIFDRKINKFLINNLIKNNKKSFLLNAGTDAFFFQNIKIRFRYSPHADYEKYDIRGVNYFKSRGYINWNKYLVKKVNGVIPIMYEYVINSNNSRSVIPIPINTEKFIPIEKESKCRNKIRIFHGLNSKSGFKGTRHICTALNKIKEEYGDLVEIVLDGNMSFEEYVKLLRTVDINIDQCNSYSYGVNAVLSMSMGITTLSGAEPESLKSFNVDKSPIINILPDHNDIFKKIESLILNPNKLKEIGVESREYCLNMHNHIKIARSFIKEWSL